MTAKIRRPRARQGCSQECLTWENSRSGCFCCSQEWTTELGPGSINCPTGDHFSVPSGQASVSELISPDDSFAWIVGRSNGPLGIVPMRSQ